MIDPRREIECGFQQRSARSETNPSVVTGFIQKLDVRRLETKLGNHPHFGCFGRQQLVPHYLPIRCLGWVWKDSLGETDPAPRGHPQFLMRFFKRKVPDFVAERISPGPQQHRFGRDFQMKSGTRLERCVPRCQMDIVLTDRYRIGVGVRRCMSNSVLHGTFSVVPVPFSGARKQNRPVTESSIL